MKKILLVAMSALLLGGGMAMAGSLHDGVGAYERGDFAQAMQLLRPLTIAGKGDARAQAHLGMMYEAGQGVAQDYAEALKYYQLAAVQGNAIAQTNIGRMYEHGRGMQADDCRN